MPNVLSIGVGAPDFFADNNFIKELSCRYSYPFWGSDIGKLESMIDDFFTKCGSSIRLIRNANSYPKKFINEAVKKCLSAYPNSIKNKISSIIYCGIDRGFVEPAHASILAAYLKFDSVRAFDVSDACCSWLTACQLSVSVSTPDKPLSLIISAEFPLDDPGLVIPDAFTIKSKEEFSWKASSLTLGEMATATLIDANSGLTPHTFRSENQHSQLCVVPIKKPERFIEWSQDMRDVDYNCFIANGTKLAIAGFRPGLSVLEEHTLKHGLPDIIIPHAFSSLVPFVAARRLNLEEKLYNVFPRVGNISTSAIPFGIWSVMQQKDFRSKKIIGWISSAGMKHVAFDINILGGNYP